MALAREARVGLAAGGTYAVDRALLDDIDEWLADGRPQPLRLDE